MFFFHPLHLKANEKTYDEVISLGTACQAAWQLKANGIRRSAYPFDWLTTPFHGLIAFLQNKGENFLDSVEIVQVLPASHGTPSMLHVKDSIYDIHSVHDFFAPDMPNYEEIKEKYARRIERFFKLLKSKDKRILFIRVQISRQEVEELDQLLHTLYPKLKYTILAVSDEPSAQLDWGLKRVKNFYMEQTPGIWAGDHGKWKDILSQFSIQPTTEFDHEEW